MLCINQTSIKEFILVTICFCILLISFPLPVRHGAWCLLQSEWNTALRQHRSRFPLPAVSKALQGHTAFRYGCGGCKEEQTGELKLLSFSTSNRLLTACHSDRGFGKVRTKCGIGTDTMRAFSRRQIFRSSWVNFCMSDPNLWMTEAVAQMIYKPHSLHSVLGKAVGHHI